MDNNQNKHFKRLEKANKAKEFLTKHSHKLDLLAGVLLLAYGIYGFFNNNEYFYVLIFFSVISFIMYFLKPVKKFDQYLSKKIIKK